MPNWQAVIPDRSPENAILWFLALRFNPRFMPSDLPPNADDRSWTDLSSFSVGDYRPGRGRFVQLAWYFVSLLLIESAWFPLTRAKPAILRCFGAKIGKGVIFKPQVRIKYPWRLTVGDHSWIGQSAWIDNLADVRLGEHVCLSQGTYLCTGSHDHRSRSFDLTPAAIELQNGCWVAADSLLLAGVTIGANAIVAAGSVVRKDVKPAQVVAGNPAVWVADRQPVTEVPRQDGEAI